MFCVKVSQKMVVDRIGVPKTLQAGVNFSPTPDARALQHSCQARGTTLALLLYPCHADRGHNDTANPILAPGLYPFWHRLPCASAVRSNVDDLTAGTARASRPSIGGDIRPDAV